MNEMKISQFEMCAIFLLLKLTKKSSKKCININAIKLIVHKSK